MRLSPRCDTLGFIRLALSIHSSQVCMCMPHFRLASSWHHGLCSRGNRRLLRQVGVLGPSSLLAAVVSCCGWGGHLAGCCHAWLLSSCSGRWLVLYWCRPPGLSYGCFCMVCRMAHCMCLHGLCPLHGLCVCRLGLPCVAIGMQPFIMLPWAVPATIGSVDSGLSRRCAWWRSWQRFTMRPDSMCHLDMCPACMRCVGVCPASICRMGMCPATLCFCCGFACWRAWHPFMLLLLLVLPATTP